MLTPKDFYKTHCSFCDKLNSNMLLCGNCKIVGYCDKGYCNRECQKKHWRHHKHICGKKLMRWPRIKENDNENEEDDGKHGKKDKHKKKIRQLELLLGIPPR